VIPGLLGLLPDDGGAQLVRLLDEEGQPFTGVPVPGSLRAATVILESGGRATVLNEPGPELGPDAQHALLEAVDTALGAEPEPLVACSGSLPPGLPPDTYGRVAGLVHAHGGTVVVDAAREALAEALPHGPDVVTPNLAEARGVLEGTTTEPSDSHADRASERTAAVAAGHALRARGARRAAVTVGSHGVAFVDDDGTEHWTDAHPVRAVNPIGAGDSFVAGLLHALSRGTQWPAAVAYATAVAGAAVQSPLAGHVEPDAVARLLPAATTPRDDRTEAAR
jgi:1-phosphofructokinase family hexose kinase